MRRFARFAVGVVGIAVLAGVTPAGVQAADDGLSPALCGPNDMPEPGIQGDVPNGGPANYNCGLTPRGQLPISGQVQGADHCAYVRTAGQIVVVDVSDPDNPTEIGSVPTFGGSESFRAVVTDERAVMVSGAGVYDISDCEHPVVKGQIDWPPVHISGIPVGLLPHDLRVNHAGTKVHATFGMWEADISNLNDPSSWTVTDHSCEVFAQFDPIHMQIADAQSLADAGLDLCVDLSRPPLPSFPFGANWAQGASALQAAILWQAFGHGPDTNGDDTRLYTADVGGGIGEILRPPTLRIVDLTQDPPQILDAIDGAGYSIDWFRADGREFVLHNSEGGTGFQIPFPGLPPQPGSDTCVNENMRPHGLGWGFSVFVTQVTPDRLATVSSLDLAINKSKFCKVRKDSGQNPFVGYHMVDNPYNAKFAAVSFGSAGLRVFDIRKPSQASEVAYFNHGSGGGLPYYDASRGLIYIGGGAFSGGGFQVLEIQPQVRARLGL